MAGWEELEPMNVVAIDRKKEDLDIMIARTFSTENGQKVLAWLREAYLENPSWQPGAESSFGFFREGQNSVIRDIEKRIKRIKE
jgi:hypothetical protein